MHAASLGAALRREMDWLSAVIDARVRMHFDPEAGGAGPPPAPAHESSRYSRLIERTGDGWGERVILALILAPHIAPETLDVFFLRNQQTDRGFTEFGGLKGVQHAGFVPTGDTALFLLAGDDIEARLCGMRLLAPDHPLSTRGVLQIGSSAPGEPTSSGALTLSPVYLRFLMTGEEAQPAFGPGFPARRIVTRLDWDDLVLDLGAKAEVETIKSWAAYHRRLLDQWGLGRHLSPALNALFYGPPGTGKTLTASLLGRELDREVYRVDLSQTVSKYIGETEKNLAAVFAEADRRNWILFFDEADALFGKRSVTTTAHDRYANQEVSFLLQRIEEHPGVVILATNFRANIDDAFLRRFHVVVHFAAPDAVQRARLWRGILGARVPMADDVDLDVLARDFELTGGQVINVVRHASLASVQRADPRVRMSDFVAAIRREQRKEGWS
jgi:hypothetical protein